jgi:hypothetical protein
MNLQQRTAFGVKLGFSAKHAAALARLDTPAKIQDFINRLPVNFEPGGDTCLSAVQALKQNRAHCIEAAFVAACALWINGDPPLLLDLQAKGEFDHVVALFRRGRCWGAISKSNHLWTRWRNPVYRSVRELAMSYFHEYISGGNRKTLWAYSVPIDMRRFDPKLWISAKDSCWEMEQLLDQVRHHRLVTPAQFHALRPRDAIERRADQLVDFPKPKKKKPSRKGRV